MEHLFFKISLHKSARSVHCQQLTRPKTEVDNFKVLPLTASYIIFRVALAQTIWCEATSAEIGIQSLLTIGHELYHILLVNVVFVVVVVVVLVFFFILRKVFLFLFCFPLGNRAGYSHLCIVLIKY